MDRLSNRIVRAMIVMEPEFGTKVGDQYEH